MRSFLGPQKNCENAKKLLTKQYRPNVILLAVQGYTVPNFKKRKKEKTFKSLLHKYCLTSYWPGKRGFRRKSSAKMQPQDLNRHVKSVKLN
jgi:hypothetical protein